MTKEVKFKVESWRDSAFSMSSPEGYGVYGKAKIMIVKLDDDQIHQVDYDKCICIDNTEICIDFDGDVCKSIETDGSIVYDFCTIMIDTTEDILDEYDDLDCDYLDYCDIDIED